jgi:hypothetical protein
MLKNRFRISTCRKHDFSMYRWRQTMLIMRCCMDIMIQSFRNILQKYNIWKSHISVSHMITKPQYKSGVTLCVLDRQAVSATRVAFFGATVVKYLVLSHERGNEDGIVTTTTRTYSWSYVTLEVTTSDYTFGIFNFS